MILKLKTAKSLLTFSVSTHFKIELEIHLLPTAIIFGPKVELIPTNDMTESLSILRNGDTVLITLTNCGYQGFETVGRMVTGQEILREMVKNENFEIEEYEFKDDDEEDLVIHGDEEQSEQSLQENPDSNDTEIMQDLDDSNPYVIGVAPPPDADVKNNFLNRTVVNRDYKDKLSKINKNGGVDKDGRKIRGRGSTKFDEYDGRGRYSRDGQDRYDMDRYSRDDRDYRRDRYDDRERYDRGYRRDRYDRRDRSRDRYNRRDKSRDREIERDVEKRESRSKDQSARRMSASRQSESSARTNELKKIVSPKRDQNRTLSPEIEHSTDSN